MTTPSTQPELPRLRCPARQHNAASHPASGRRKCSGMGLESIKRVREHLQNCHRASTEGQSGGNEPDSEPPTLTQEQIEAIRDVTSEKCKDTADSRKRKWVAIYRIIYPAATEIPPPFCFETDYVREKAENPDEELVSILATHHFGNSAAGAREWLRVVGSFLNILGGGDTHIGDVSTVEHGRGNESGGVEGHGVHVDEQHGNDHFPVSASGALFGWLHFE